MNIFLGLPIPVQNIQVLQDLLIQEHPAWQNNSAIRWTAEANHHLTVHFFGQIEPDLLKDFIEHLSGYIESIHEFSITISKIDNFPKEKADLIAGYVHLSARLAKLYHQVQQAVADHHFPVEQRPYLPHITLCRGKRRNVLTMNPLVLAEYSIAVST